MQTVLCKTVKFHNRILVLLLILSLLLSGMNAEEFVSYASTVEQEFVVGDNVRAILYDSGLMQLSGFGDTYQYSEDNMTPYYGLRDRILSVEIDEGITSIGACLFFNCGNLSGTLTLPSTLTTIGNRAFSGDTKETAPSFSYIMNEFTQADVVEDVPSQPETPDLQTVSDLQSNLDVQAVPNAQAIAEPMDDSKTESGLEKAAQEESELETEIIADSEEETKSKSESEPKEDIESKTEGEAEEDTESKTGTEAEEDTESKTDTEPMEETKSENEAESEEEPQEVIETEDEASIVTETEEEITKRIVTIHEQTIGESIFAEEQVGVVHCTDENESFKNAVLSVGYQKITGYTETVFDDGFGNQSTLTVPITEQGIFLPVYASTQLEWPSEKEATYSFDGWNDGRVTYSAGSFCPLADYLTVGCLTAQWYVDGDIVSVNRGVKNMGRMMSPSTIETIDLDISKGSVIIGRDGKYTYFDNDGIQQTGDHVSGNYYKITGTAGTTDSGNNNIQLWGEGDFNIILDNVTIHTGSPEIGTCAPVSTENVTGTGNINVFLKGKNRLVNNCNNTSGSYAALEKGSTGSTLIIDSWSDAHEHSDGGCTDACGSLEAIGGADSAGIGGSDNAFGNGQAKNIVINGGVLSCTTQKSGGAGIGAGNNQQATGIVINGGYIEAEGVENGAGIGGSGGITGDGAYGEITINGGHVKAVSIGNGAGIGGGGSNTGKAGSGEVTILGGIIETKSIGGADSLTSNGGYAVVDIRGGFVTTDYIGGGNTNIRTAGYADVEITGGTVAAKSIGAGFSKGQGYANAEVIIGGGSINAMIAATPTNGASNGNKAVFLTRTAIYYGDVNQHNYTIDSVEAIGASYYGKEDLKTDSVGILYLWLPEGAELKKATNASIDFTGSVYVKSIGVLKASCVDQYYSINIANCNDYYRMYTDEQCTMEFSGAVTVKSGTLVDWYVQAEKESTENYYVIDAYYSSRIDGRPVMTPLVPVNVPQNGMYHYQISVTSDTQILFTYEGTSGQKNMVLDMRNADVVISEGTLVDLLNVAWKGYVLSDYDGTFLLTSNGVNSGNTLMLLSGEADVHIDRLMTERSGSIIKVDGGTLNLNYSSSFDNQIKATAQGQSAIEVKSGATLKILAGTEDNSLLLSGGNGAPAIGGSGSVIIEKNQDFLVLNAGLAAVAQIEAADFTYMTSAVQEGQVPYSVELSTGELIGYQSISDSCLYAIDAPQSAGTYKTCGVRYILNEGVTKGTAQIVNQNYQVSFNGAVNIQVLRDGSVLTPDSDYTWSANVLTIRGVAAYGNIVVSAGAADAILYSTSNYSGKYDGQPHTIELTVPSTISSDDYTIYYSTTVSINEAPDPMNLPEGVTITNPEQTDVTTSLAEGKLIVYWYIDYTNGNNLYADVSGQSTISVQPGNNEWVVGLTCPSIPKGGELIQSAEAKWGDVIYEFCKNPDFAGTLSEPITVEGPKEIGSYYIRAKVVASVSGNYPELLSEPLRFSIEATKIYTSAGKVLSRLGGDPSNSATIAANGAFTILYSLAYSSDPSKVLSLEFNPALPEGTKITLMDISRSNDPGYFYYIVGPAGCSKLLSQNIFVMGTSNHPVYADFFNDSEVFTAQYQYCIEYPQAASATGNQEIKLLQGDVELSDTKVTVSRSAAATSPTGGIAPSENPSVEYGNLHVPVKITASGSDTKVLAVSLLDDSGNVVEFPDGALMQCKNNEGTELEQVAFRRKIAIFNLGTANIENQNYDIEMSNLATDTSSSYKVKMDVCVVKQEETSYPMHGQIANLTTDSLSINASAEDELKVTQTTSTHSGSGGMRVVESGTETTLTFSLTYKSVNGSDSIAVISQSKQGDEYNNLPEQWTVAGTPLNSLSQNVESTLNGITITVPQTVEAGTYRILFRLGTLYIPYSIIVE